MTVKRPTEELIEDAATAALAAIRCQCLRGASLAESGLTPERGLIGSLLRDAILRLNPHLAGDKAAVEQVVRTLRSAPHPTFVENNRWFHRQLVDGVEVE